jgi:hypothetical protein
MTSASKSVYSKTERSDLVEMLMEMGTWTRAQCVSAVEKANGDPEDAMDLLLTEQLTEVEATPAEVVQSSKEAVVAPPQVSRTMRSADRPQRLSKQDSLRKLYNIASKRTQQRENDALVGRLRAALKLPVDDPSRTTATIDGAKQQQQQQEVQTKGKK